MTSDVAARLGDAPPGAIADSREAHAGAALDMQQLTFTRFVAAMAVVVFHWASVWPALNDWLWKYRLHIGPTMVSYFYVLSGFIMVVVYLQPGGMLDSRRYWAARAARVYPVYLLGVVLMAIPLGLGVGGSRLDPVALLLNVLLLQAWIPQYALSVNSPGWSLSVEAFFYILFPFLLLLMARMKSERTMLAVTAAVWLASQVLYHLGYGRLIAHDPIVSHEVLHYNPLVHVNAFLIGMCAGMLVRRHRASLQTHSGARYPRATLAALWLSLALSVALMMNLNRVADVIPLSTTNGLIAPLFAVFIAALSIDNSRLTSMLRQAPFVLLGELSYAVYILQIPVSLGVRAAFGGERAIAPAMLFAIYLMALIALSFLVYRYYETPLRSGLRRCLSGEPRR